MADSEYALSEQRGRGGTGPGRLSGHDSSDSKTAGTTDLGSLNLYPRVSTLGPCVRHVRTYVKPSTTRDGTQEW